MAAQDAPRQRAIAVRTLVFVAVTQAVQGLRHDSLTLAAWRDPAALFMLRAQPSL